MAEQQYTLDELFEAFVVMRRQGATPDYAIGLLRQQYPQITPDERTELGLEIRRWEKQEGHRYPPDPEARVAFPIFERGSEEDWSEEIKCSHCGTINNSKANYCFACGTMLTRLGTQQLYDEGDEEKGGGTATFGKLSSLVFTVRGFENAPLHVSLTSTQEIIIGRTAQDSVITPDVDLINYDAQNLGVSRVHLTLKRQENNITISDMGSSNYTYLNGERVYPQEVRVLRDGDELRLGKLVMRVAFQRQLRRIN